MPTIAVKPELIRWAIERSGLPVDDLLEKFPKLNEWRSGEKQPTFRQLEKFARTTMTPFGAMFLDEPPREKLPISDFRTRGAAELGRRTPDAAESDRADRDCGFQ